MRSTQKSIQLFPSRRASGAFALCALPALVGIAHEVRAQAGAALPVPPAIAADNAPAPKGGPARFDIEFLDIPVADLLVAIAKQGGVEISIAGDVTGNLKFVSYKNVTAEEAVERVADDAGLFWGRRGEQYVLAGSLDGLKPDMRRRYTSGQSTRPHGGIPANPLTTGETWTPGINAQNPLAGGIGNQAQYIPELDSGSKRDKSKQTALMRLRNVPPRMMAYWLDPANNPPDIQTRTSNDSFEATRNQVMIRPVAPELFAGSMRPQQGNSYPTGIPMMVSPGMFTSPGAASQFAQGGYQQPYNPTWGAPAPPTTGEWQNQSRNGWGQPFVQARPRIGQFPGQFNQPFVRGNPQFGGGFGQGQGQGGFGQGGQGQGGFGQGGQGQGGQQQQQINAVFQLPDGIEAMTAVDAQNALLIRGTAQGVEELQQIVDLLDQPLKQVEIEAMFVTLTKGEGKNLGINFSSSNGPFSATMTTGATEGNFILGYTGRNFTAQLGAALSHNRAKIVTAPRVVAINNLTATIQSTVTNTVLLSNTVIGQGNGNGGNVAATNLIPFQITTSVGISVTPTINGDGTITVLMQPQVQQQGQPTSANPIPTVSSQVVQTVAFVRDGDTIALGGLRNRAFNDTKQRVPVLSSIPFLGRLFEGISHSDRDEDLIIFLTAKIVRRFTDQDEVPGT